ncbi:hypothetical protein [Noviherbaspirillum autotrophicum]|uniref:Uncharacterized protein n=1 Tax=Noviherbaspirillum autotrophicum TaxID=709839 RepID=A0A0C1YRI9_9BURK|nr:hypothetical protein [Noviherbaspirillum autotrophicum]KIF83287.1 hypothetical protein TSA66_24585 [Noviherbaspirillum autotrophicum]
MGKPIADNAKFRSSCEHGYPELADKLKELNPDAFLKQRRGEGLLKTDSLAAYLSDLDRGKPDWWDAHLAAAETLRGFLGLPDLAALGIHRKDPATFLFPAFPALPPVNFAAGDAPWAIGTAQHVQGPGAGEQLTRYGVRQTLDCWMAARSRAFDDRPMDWLHVPDVLEFKLILNRLASAWRQPPLRWASVAKGMRDDQALLQDPAPLIIELSAPATAFDVDQLFSSRGHAPLLVVARHPLPDPREGRNSGAPGSLAGQDPVGGELAAESEAWLAEMARIAGVLGQIRYWIWRLEADWRNQVIDWALARVKGSRPVTAHAIKTRLNEIDPGESIFTQTSDVLELCHVMHVGNGIPWDLLRADAACNRDIDGGPDLAAAQRERMRRVLVARWADFDTPWEWPAAQECVPIAVDEDDLEDGPDSKGAAAADLTRDDFRHPLIAKLLFRVELRKMLVAGPLAEWAQGAFDAQRRALLDNALEQLSIEELTTVAQRVTAGIRADADQTLTLAAAEALFVAVGRQIARRRIDPNKALRDGAGEALAVQWKGVVDVVLAHLDHTNPRQPAWPWTRAVDTPATRLEWISACWAWSLTPARPAVPATGLFPWWSGLPRKEATSDLDRPICTLQPSATPQWLVDCLAENERQYTGQAAPVWRDFVSVLDLCLAASKELPPDNPTMLTYSAAWLRAPVEGEVRDSARHWASIVGKRWQEHAVLASVRSPALSPEMRREVACRWWPKLVAHQQGDKHGALSRYGQRRWNYVAEGRSELLDWVAQEVKHTAARAVDDLTTEQCIFLVKCPKELPASIKRALLAWLAARPDDDYPNLKAAAGPLPSWLLFEHFGPDVVEDFPLFLSSSAGGEAARLLWLWAPGSAVQLLQADDPPEIGGLANLLRSCPLGYLRVAIAALQQSPQILAGPERVAWVKRYLPYAGTAATDLVKLVKPDATAAALIAPSASAT